MDRLALIRRAHRRDLRARGLPCGLSAGEVREVINDVLKGKNPEELADFYGVTPRTIERACIKAPDGVGRFVNHLKEMRERRDRRAGPPVKRKRRREKA